MSTSLWGRELKGDPWTLRDFSTRVDLLVRSWIERWLEVARSNPILVDLLVRSWIESLPLSSLSRAEMVDLLVRSWIERSPISREKWRKKSTSLWGRELKDIMDIQDIDKFCRPPCEVVNWKNSLHEINSLLYRRPPCEVVNWKGWEMTGSVPVRRSTSLWGRELKDV